MIDLEDDRFGDDALARSLRNAAPHRFADGFVERVAARLRAQHSRVPSFDEVLQRQFLRIIPLAAAASLILGLYSWWGGRAISSSLIDAALRLPAVTIANAYTTDELFVMLGGSD
jgi:hypothetical protein